MRLKSRTVSYDSNMLSAGSDLGDECTTKREYEVDGDNLMPTTKSKLFVPVHLPVERPLTVGICNLIAKF